MTHSLVKNTSFALRRHLALNPVTSAYEPFIALDSSHRLFEVSGTIQALTLVSATIASTTEASPDGGTIGKLVQNTTATNTHGVSFSTSQTITNGDRMAMSFVAKAGTLTKIKVYYGTVATTTVIATFDLSNGTKVSGDSRLKIRPAAGDDPVSSGWYEIYSAGVVKDANIGSSLLTIRGLKVSDDSENYTGTTAENWYIFKYNTDYQNRGLGRLYDVDVAFVNARTSNSECLAFDIGATLETPQAMSVYMEWLDRGNAIGGASPGIFRIGDVDNTASGSLKVIQTSTGFEGTYENAAGTSTCNISLVPTDGQLVGLLATLDATGALQISAFVNAETEVVGTAGTARGFDTPWSDTLICVGSLMGASVGDMHLRKCNLYSGVADLAALRAA